MKKEKVKIAFVGVGGMGQCAHLLNYITIPDCEVVAIAELREGLAQKVASRYGIPRVYKNHEELLSKEKIDGIVASQNFIIHGQLIPALYSLGIPILTEKPLAGALSAGKKILAALKGTRAKHFVGYHKRSDPATMFAKKEIERLKQTKELGDLRYIRMTMPSGDWIANGFSYLLTSEEDYPSLTQDPNDPEYNQDKANQYICFVNFYIHQVNLIRHLLGENYKITYADPNGILLIAQSISGITCTLEMNPYTTTLDWQEEALIAFERGYIKLQLPAPLAVHRPGKITIYRDPSENETPQKITPQLPWIHAMRQQAIHYVKAIQGEKTPLCEATEAFEDLQTATDYLKIFQSHHP